MKIKMFTIASFILLVLVLFSASCSAQNYAEYAPILYFESEETCYPIDAEFQLTYSYLYDVDNNIPVSTDPSSIDLSRFKN